MKTNWIVRTTMGAALAAAALTAGPAAAGLVPGGGKESTAAADCYAELDVTGLEGATVTIDSKGKPTVNCQDGALCDTDGEVNDTCVLKVTPCINQSNVEGCTPPAALEKFKVKGKVKGVKGSAGKIIIDTSQLLEGSACGAILVDIPMPIKVKGNGEKVDRKGSINLNAKADADPKKDKDKIGFVCAPQQGSTTTTTLPSSSCTQDNANGPDQLKLTVAQEGNDLDNGWTGVSHNFAVTPNGNIIGCLSECNLDTDTECTVNGTVGEGSLNGPFFGAPLPLIAAGVPVCVVNNFDQTITGTANWATGDIGLHVTLLADVHLTVDDNVCPRCNNGNCNAGPNQGRSCTTEATLFVAESNGSKTYNLSRDCPPQGPPDATLNINFNPLTSGTTGDLVGEIPCPRPPGTPIGVPPQPNDCGGTHACGSPCTGNACVEMVPDPVDPGTMVCKDNKGGISQVCCNNNTTVPCFPLENGGTVNRTGRAEPPAPVFPDTSFPKTGTGTLASVFCEAATGTSTIDLTTGLPGPAALLLTGPQEWSELPD